VVRVVVRVVVVVVVVRVVVRVVVVGGGSDSSRSSSSSSGGGGCSCCLNNRDFCGLLCYDVFLNLKIRYCLMSFRAMTPAAELCDHVVRRRMLETTTRSMSPSGDFGFKHVDVCSDRRMRLSQRHQSIIMLFPNLVIFCA
jgi:hypothetical protein